jgi:virginiamycin B lyase
LTLQGDPPSIGVVDASDCADALQNCEPREFPLPFDGVTPKFITVDSHGKIWFTAVDGEGGLILSFDPETEVFNSHPIPEQFGTEPHDIAVSSRGTIWFTDLGIGLISFNPETGDFVEQYRTPEASLGEGRVAALGVSLDSSGGVWCTCGLDLVRIGLRVIRGLRVVVIREVLVLPVPEALKPHGVFAENANVAWVLDQHTARLHRFDRVRDAFDSWSLPGAKFIIDPHWLVKRGESVYFTGFAGVLGRFDTARETFDAYVVSPSRAELQAATGAFDIAMDRAGRVWLTEINPETLSRLGVQRFPPPRIPPPVPDFP